MPKFKICYTMDVLYEIEVDAEDSDTAFDMVKYGKADYDTAVETDTEFGCINSITEI